MKMSLFLLLVTTLFLRVTAIHHTQQHREEKIEREDAKEIEKVKEEVRK